jgi:phosphatidylserine decarboxylase
MIAKEGAREIVLATALLGPAAALAGWYWWPAAIPIVLVWAWVLSFFRDPRRDRRYAPGELCSPADGTVTEITELPAYDSIDGPAVRIGIFLSLFNVHVNRAPCSGSVRRITYRSGEHRDARDPESGSRNESNTLVMDPDAPLPGPVVVRQVAGMMARRIVSHARQGGRLTIGERFGLIKFGSRTELIFPLRTGTRIDVRIGTRVRGGMTILATQSHESNAGLVREETKGPSSFRQVPASASASIKSESFT